MNKNKNTYRKGNGRKPRTRREEKDDKETKEVRDNKSYKDKSRDSQDKKNNKLYEYNDPTYYVKDPEILAQATQLSFQNILGIEPINKYEVPTIMTIHMNPSVGLTYQGANPAFLSHPSRAGINLASLELFNQLSMKSGRNMAYAPQDIGIMIGALSQVLAIVSFLRRALGVAKLTNFRNRMYPKAMLEATGIDYDDLVNHWADYRAAFNNEIAVLNQIPILMNCGYLKKSVNQYDFIFTDSDSPMSQTYIYVPETTWVIDETSSQDGSILKTIPVVGNGTNRATHVRTFAWYMQNVFRPMVDALLTSSTLNLVYADLLNLGSQSSNLEFYSIPIVPEDYVVQPMHNYEALLHIHNLTAMGVPTCPSRTGYYTPNNDVYCDPSNNALIYNPGFAVSVNPMSVGEVSDVIIDSPVPDPSLDAKLEMTRYKSYGTGNLGTVNNVSYSFYNLLTDYYVTYVHVISNEITVDANGKITSGTYSALRGPASDFGLNLFEKLSQFDWAPMVITTEANAGVANSANINGILGDLNYFTTVDKYYIERLMSIVYLGLFQM